MFEVLRWYLLAPKQASVSTSPMSTPHQGRDKLVQASRKCENELKRLDSCLRRNDEYVMSVIATVNF